MRFLGIGLVFFAFAAPAFGRVPPDDPVIVPPVAIFWTDGPAPDVPAAPAETPKFDMCKPHPGIEVKIPAWCRVGPP